MKVTIDRLPAPVPPAQVTIVINERTAHKLRAVLGVIADTTTRTTGEDLYELYKDLGSVLGCPSVGSRYRVSYTGPAPSLGVINESCP